MQGRAGGTAAADAFTQGVIQCWNLLGGEVHWEAIEAVAAIVGVEDIDGLVRGLTQIRDHFLKIRAEEARLAGR